MGVYENRGVPFWKKGILLFRGLCWGPPIFVNPHMVLSGHLARCQVLYQESPSIPCLSDLFCGMLALDEPGWNIWQEATQALR